MAKLRVFVTRTIPSEGIALLKKDKRLAVDVYASETAIPRKELLKRVKGVDVILSILTEKMDEQVMKAAGPQLKMIANYAVGFDNIDLKAAAARGITVTNAANPNISLTVAEHTVALIFALAHRIVDTDAFTRAGKYKAWGPLLLLGTDVSGKTLGLIGSGAIGSQVAKSLHNGFGMNVVYTDLKPNEQLEKETGAKFMTQDEVLKTGDFVSIHVPLLPTTRHLISKKQLKMMKKTAFLINTSRGPIVDEIALIQALKAKTIGGAGLDVYESEPLIAKTAALRKTLASFPNVVLTPHTASATAETRQAMSRAAAENILTFVDGKTPPNVVRSK